MGEPGAIVMNAPMVPRLAASKLEFRICRPGRCSGFDDILAESFKKATMEPVKVMPPEIH